MASISSLPNTNFFLRSACNEARGEGEAEFKHFFTDRPMTVRGKHPGVHFFRWRGVEYAFATPARRIDPMGGVRCHDGIDHLGNRYYVKKVGTRREKYGDLWRFASYEIDGPHAIGSPVTPVLEAKYGTTTSGHTALFIPLKTGDIFRLCLRDHPVEIEKRARSAYAAMKQLCKQARDFHAVAHQAHLDIKPQNVFHDGVSLIIGDYGSAAHLDGNPANPPLRSSAEFSTLGFSSPELFPSGPVVSGPLMAKIDAWGIALVCLSVFGFNPFGPRVISSRDYTESAVMLAHLEFERIRRNRNAIHVTLSADVATATGQEHGAQVLINLERAAYWRNMWRTAEDHLDPALLKCIHGMLDADAEKRLGVEAGIALPARDLDTDFIWTGAPTDDDTREERFAQLKQDLETVSRLWPYKPPQRRSVKSTVPAGVGVGLLSTFTVQTLSYILPMVSFAAGWWIFWVAAPVAGIMVGVLVCRQLWVWGELSDEVKAEIEANRPRQPTAAPAVTA